MANSVARSMEYSDSVKHRLHRIEGQLRGVLNMMEQSKECSDVVTQLTAIRSAVDRAIALIIADNMEACIRKEIENDSNLEAVIKEGIQLLVKSR